MGYANLRFAVAGDSTALAEVREEGGVEGAETLLGVVSPDPEDAAIIDDSVLAARVGRILEALGVPWTADLGIYTPNPSK